MQSDDLFGFSKVKGFTYRPGLLTAQQESRQVACFEKLDLKPFEFHGHLGNRRTLSFGWRYDYGKARAEKAAPIPSHLLDLREIAGAFLGRDPKSFEHVLVTEYAPGAGIGWHRDKAVFRHVIAFSFLASCRLRFRRARDGGWDRLAVQVEPRSGYILDGEARAVWEHSIPPLDAKRYSVTFRDLRK